MLTVSRTLLPWLAVSWATQSLLTIPLSRSVSNVAMADSTVNSGQQQQSSCPSSSSSVPGPSGYLVGYVTISNAELGTELAKKLVNAGLVACVNVLPTVTSVYKWQGKLETDSESLLILKTQSNRSEQVVKFVRENHPYDLPEVIFTPIVQGNPDYLRWISQSVNAGSGSDSAC